MKHNSTEINISPDDLRTKYSRLDISVFDQFKAASIAYDNHKNKKKGGGKKEKNETKENAK